MRLTSSLVRAVLGCAALTALQATASAAELEPAAQWQNETLMGPARQAAEVVKASFSYQSEAKKLTFKLESKTVEMTLGSKAAKAGGKAITLTEAPKVVNGTSYVPLKQLLIGLGSEIKPGGEDAWIICVGNKCIRLEVPPKPE